MQTDLYAGSHTEESLGHFELITVFMFFIFIDKLLQVHQVLPHHSTGVIYVLTVIAVHQLIEIFLAMNILMRAIDFISVERI